MAGQRHQGRAVRKGKAYMPVAETLTCHGPARPAGPEIPPQTYIGPASSSVSGLPVPSSQTPPRRRRHRLLLSRSRVGLFRNALCPVHAQPFTCVLPPVSRTQSLSANQHCTVTAPGIAARVPPVQWDMLQPGAWPPRIHTRACREGTALC